MKYLSYRSGIIVEISESSNENFKYIMIAKDVNDIYTYTKLVYSQDTIILDCEYSEIGIDDLNIGDYVFAYHSNRMTMSIPPQTSAYIIEVK